MSERIQLRGLARSYGIQTSYHDVFGQLKEPPPEAVLSVLRLLGAPMERMSDLSGAVRARRQVRFQQIIDPVVVVWHGSPASIHLRLPSRFAETNINCTIGLESGGAVESDLRDNPSSKPVQRRVEGSSYVRRRVALPPALPLGYHRLHVQLGDISAESHLFVAPSRAFGEDKSRKKSWGLFCPVYALTSAKSWGVGDFSDLRRLVEFVGELGGSAVGTLPLFSAFLDEPFNPSPYSPVSRLFWNELFLDVSRIAELKRCIGARAMIRSAAFENELESVRAAPLVDYRRVMLLKRKILYEILRCLMNLPSRRRDQFDHFVQTHPLAQDYAAFRAKTEGERRSWQQWDGPSRDGALRSGDYLEQIKQYHLFVQWQAHEQMRDFGVQSRSPELYLDFPLGVDRDGYDVWRERSAFALEASGGAPPDSFFIKGQNWGFPPLHPEGLRHQGYRYYIHCVRHHLQYAKMLRIDHVMGLYRFYWVPNGFAPNEGVYVRYPAEEFFAVLNLESHRFQAQIVGENLGTVPSAVNARMVKHNIRGMHVAQFGVRADPKHALDPVPPHVVASLNTHDTPTFAAFWTGTDIDDRRELGLLTDETAARERAERAQQRLALTAYLQSRGLLHDERPNAETILTAWLSYLAADKEEFLSVSLEDLWLETLPQNVPGTYDERPNWKRKARYSLEQLRELPALRKTLQTINQIRKSGR